MKRSRRKFEELTWIFGLHGTARRLYQATQPAKVRKAANLRKFYSELVPERALIFDIGANVGIYAEILHSLGARVIAVDPNPDCMRHIELACGNRVELIQAAVGRRPGIASFNLSDAHDDMSTMADEWISACAKVNGDRSRVWNRRISVPVITLDSLVEHYGVPHYIKIDVEGFEKEVLSGLSVLPPLVSFEFHSTFIENAIACLENRIFATDCVFNLTDVHETAMELESWVSREHLLQIISEMKDTYRDIYVKHIQ